MKMSSEKIYNEFKSFRKKLNDAIHIDDMIEVDYEYGLDTDFLKEDADEMIKLLNQIKISLGNIKESMK